MAFQVTSRRAFPGDGFSVRKSLVLAVFTGAPRGKHCRETTAFHAARPTQRGLAVRGRGEDKALLSTLQPSRSARQLMRQLQTILLCSENRGDSVGSMKVRLLEEIKPPPFSTSCASHTLTPRQTGPAFVRTTKQGLHFVSSWKIKSLGNAGAIILISTPEANFSFASGSPLRRVLSDASAGRGSDAGTRPHVHRRLSPVLPFSALWESLAGISAQTIRVPGMRGEASRWE